MLASPRAGEGTIVGDWYGREQRNQAESFPKRFPVFVDAPLCPAVVHWEQFAGIASDGSLVLCEPVDEFQVV